MCFSAKNTYVILTYDYLKKIQFYIYDHICNSAFYQQVILSSFFHPQHMVILNSCF
jgi:hypothetical protein